MRVVAALAKAAMDRKTMARVETTLAVVVAWRSCAAVSVTAGA